MTFEKIAKLPRRSRSKYLNAPADAGVDARSTGGRLYRDTVLGLLEPLGGEAASTRAQVTARVLGRLTVELARLESIEADGPLEAMAALSKYVDLAARMARTLRAFDRLIAIEPHTKQRDADPVRSHIEKNYGPVAVI